MTALRLQASARPPPAPRTSASGRPTRSCKQVQETANPRHITTRSCRERDTANPKQHPTQTEPSCCGDTSVQKPPGFFAYFAAGPQLIVHQTTSTTLRINGPDHLGLLQVQDGQGEGHRRFELLRLRELLPRRRTPVLRVPPLVRQRNQRGGMQAGHTGLASFKSDVWLPLFVCDGE